LPLTPCPCSISLRGKSMSAERKTSNGALLESCEKKFPEEPYVGTTWIAGVPFSNAATTSARANFRSEAAATRASRGAVVVDADLAGAASSAVVFAAEPLGEEGGRGVSLPHPARASRSQRHARAHDPRLSIRSIVGGSLG